MKYYLAIKNEMMPFIETRMVLEINVLHEVKGRQIP